MIRQRHEDEQRGDGLRGRAATGGAAVGEVEIVAVIALVAGDELAHIAAEGEHGGGVLAVTDRAHRVVRETLGEVREPHRGIGDAHGARARGLEPRRARRRGHHAHRRARAGDDADQQPRGILEAGEELDERVGVVDVGGVARRAAGVLPRRGGRAAVAVEAEAGAAERGEGAERALRVVERRRGVEEQLGLRRRAVVLIGEDDDRQEGVVAQEAGVLGHRAVERAAHRGQRLLQAAAGDPQGRDAHEGVLERPAVVALPAVAGDLVGDERAGRRRAAGDTRRVLQRAAVALVGAGLGGVAAGAEIGRHHAHVQAGQPPGQRRELADEQRQVERLLLAHRVRVVDDEQHVELLRVEDGLLAHPADRALLGAAPDEREQEQELKALRRAPHR
jgi:hypothetical protein